MKNSSGCKRSLIITVVALIESAAGNKIVFFATAAGARKAVWPPHIKKVLLAGFLAIVVT